MERKRGEAGVEGGMNAERGEGGRVQGRAVGIEFDTGEYECEGHLDTMCVAIVFVVDSF